MKKNRHIHEFQVTVTGFQPNGVPVSMDMLVHAKTETAAMFKAEDILSLAYIQTAAWLSVGHASIPLNLAFKPYNISD